MPTPRSLAGYPEWFFTIAERAQSAGYTEELPMKTRGIAINIRQRFYSFRQLLAEEKHPLAPGCLDLVLQLDGTTLRFSKDGGLEPAALAALGLDQPKPPAQGAVISTEAAAQAAEDEAEAELERLLGLEPRVSKNQEPAPDTHCPPHELDITETRCLHCGIPAGDFT